ncbi:MAG: YitT family protein [Spirochaetales bacterium]|nr:YitT family protein [Spirochaetales bacterium]
MKNTGRGPSPCGTVKRVLLVVAGALIMAFNLNTFVHAGGLLPGGFTGLALLIQECALRFAGKEIPFSILLYVFNAIPALISFKYIGKKFTLYTCLMIFLSGLLTDWMPAMFIEHLQVHDTYLSAIFGGILNAVAISMCLFADATSGGTDFIAIFLSEKYKKDAWNYIFAGNCVILIAAGYIFSIDKALYSIIFQFATTMALQTLYRGYQQKTLLVITSRPDRVYTLIRDETHHGATSFTGTGLYEMENRVMIYSVVSANQANKLAAAIRKIDPRAFINIIRTEQILGRFHKAPKD